MWEGKEKWTDRNSLDKPQHTNSRGFLFSNHTRSLGKLFNFDLRHIYEHFGGVHASILGGVVVYGTYASGVPDLFSV